MTSSVHGVLPENKALKRCGAMTRTRSLCRRFPAAGRERCRLHGGASTGPKTLEGKARIGRATRERYIRGATDDGWELLSDATRAGVISLLARLRNSRNGTAKELRITTNGLRRVLARLPLRPEESIALGDYFGPQFASTTRSPFL